MSIRFLAVLALVTPLLFAGPVRADTFFSVIEDLPVMQGMSENENAAVTFETAGGRIAEAAARGRVSPDAVRAFYADVLPQLGWTPGAEGVYARDGERLKISVAADGSGGAVLTLSLSPAGR